MREIKFRCWDKREKEMLDEVEKTYDWESMPFCNGENDHYALMQYTGVKDKNKKEIYFGDYGRLHIKVTHDDGIHEEYCWGYVKGSFSQGLWVVKNKEQYFSRDGVLGPINNTVGKSKLAGYRFEVSGNIHENPELLGRL